MPLSAMPVSLLDHHNYSGCHDELKLQDVSREA